jgi:hypothetical protein
VIKGILAALLMAALLALYLVLVAERAVLFFATGTAIGVVIGVALFVLPLIGLWALGRELLFGIRSQQLVTTLGAEGGLPVDDVPRLPSGRPDRSAADLEFDRYRDEAEAHPDDWRAWLRLGIAYDASRDRRRARAAVRTAITLSRRS